MNKKQNGAAAPKRYESLALAILDVNLENGYASGVDKNAVNDMPYWDEWEEVKTR